MLCEKFLSWLRGLPDWLILGTSLSLSLGLFYLDSLSSDYSLIILYVAPIWLASWHLKARPSLLVSVICACESVLDNILDSLGQFSLWSFRTWNSLTEAVFLIIAGHLLNRLKHQLELHKELAFTDPLSGLLNRRSFFELANYELSCSRRYGRSATLIYIDLDDFKSVNDRYGHDKGDKVLVKVAQTLRGQLRAGDVVCRIGGDEFVALLPETRDEAKEKLKTLHGAINIAVQNEVDNGTVSMGAVTFNTVPLSLDEMMKLADQLMYNAKKCGKNYFRHLSINGNNL
jgi:diguanylate cyclase (GGDEF)-like protein